MADLRNCRPERIRRALDRLSASLDETCERPSRRAHTGSDTPRLRSPIGHPLASSRDVSGHDCRTLSEGDTHVPRENVVHPSGSRARLYPPELPPPASLFSPHRPSEVKQPPPQPCPAITSPSQAESQYAWPTSGFNTNPINRGVGQPVREYRSTNLFLMHGSGLSRS